MPMIRKTLSNSQDPNHNINDLNDRITMNIGHWFNRTGILYIYVFRNDIENSVDIINVCRCMPCLKAIIE